MGKPRWIKFKTRKIRWLKYNEVKLKGLIFEVRHCEILRFCYVTGNNVFNIRYLRSHPEHYLFNLLSTLMNAIHDWGNKTNWDLKYNAKKVKILKRSD